MVDASQKMALLAGSKMAEIVPASVYQAGLKKIVGSADQHRDGVPGGRLGRRR